MASETTDQAPTLGGDKNLAQADEAMLTQLSAVMEEAGFFVAPELDGDTLVLSGEIDSEENRQAALDIARALAEPRGLRVDASIDVLETSPDKPFLGRGLLDDAVGNDAFGYADPDANPNARLDPTLELEADFTNDIGTTDSEMSAAEAEPYFPPTDPVVRPTGDAEQLAVVGGFGATSMDDLVGSASFDIRNDDDLAMAVRQELEQDALTIDLRVRVAAIDGTVTLRGEVPTLEDAENAEAVASRVGGVREVREELTIPGMRAEH